MAAATVADKIEVAPAWDIVELSSVTTGLTYTTKLSEIVAVHAQNNTTTKGASAAVATWSGQTVTISGLFGGITPTVTLIIAGRL